MQDTTLQDALLSWKQRHCISDRAFEELILLQTLMPSPIVWPTPTIPGPSNFSVSYPLSHPVMHVWSGNHSVSYNESNDMISEPYENRAAESPWVYLSPAALGGEEATTGTTVLPGDDSILPLDDGSMFGISNDLLQQSVASSESALEGNRDMKIGCASKAKILKNLCIRARFADSSVFSKWQNTFYQSKSAWEGLVVVPGKLTYATIRHFAGGPTLSVRCKEYTPQVGDEGVLFYKTTSGWSSMMTTSYSAASKVDLASYVNSHVDYFLKKASTGGWLTEILLYASANRRLRVIDLTLRLWTAHQLLMQGWELSTNGSLGMTIVTDQTSSLYGTTPAPRVLQNQLDRALEDYCAFLEYKCLQELQRTEYKWRHPMLASKLIEKSLHESNVLLGHLYHVAGGVPKEFQVNFEFAKMPQLPAQERYDWSQPSSLDYSLCVLVFATEKSGNIQLAQPKFFGC
ncbi:hypothetical protein ACEQ8H_000908 [Pleosporales sp. CAS-2024a]